MSISIDNHVLGSYNGLYVAQPDLWNGYVHFVNENDIHLHFQNVDGSP